MAKSKPQGFTIIEVIIVLAIAGLILLIVFLAVPSVQRNARNTRRKRDLGRFYAAIQEEQNKTLGQKAPFPGDDNWPAPNGLPTSNAQDHADFDAFVAGLDQGFSQYTIPWTEAGDADHHQDYPPDVLVYFALHHCRQGGEEDGFDPPRQVAGSHEAYTFSVLIGLEPERPDNYYCLDNDD